MFGYVTASWKELEKCQQDRYSAVYCGICRDIYAQASGSARLGLSHDMTFLALLLMSLYEPRENGGKAACLLHPLRPRPWVDNVYIRYAADMNVALAYYQCLDDWNDDRKLSARILSTAFARHCPAIQARYPRQCGAIRQCIGRLSRLEKQGCDNPDLVAACFGDLMGELLVFKEDLWAPTLRQMGNALGRFIYLLDAVVDYDRDAKKGKYNPFLAMNQGKDPETWKEYLVLTMGRCTDFYERLPLVQDKELMDNILYSGVWAALSRQEKKEAKKTHDRRSL